MTDELRLCANCHHEHRYGILRYSQDNVPLYGARVCDYAEAQGPHMDDGVFACSCDHFAAAADGDVREAQDALNLPALPQEQLQALWSKTAFLNAQVPAATRIAISGIMQLLEVGAHSLDPAIAGAAREFMGLMMSQITDVRGALTRSDSKFARLVSHTDEIVEAMKGVVQLKERLDNICGVQERILERLDSLTKGSKIVESRLNSDWNLPGPGYEELCARCRHMRALHRKGSWCVSRETRESPDCGCSEFVERATLAEAAHVFAAKSAPLWNESIPTEASEGDLAVAAFVREDGCWYCKSCHAVWVNRREPSDGDRCDLCLQKVGEIQRDIDEQRSDNSD